MNVINNFSNRVKILRLENQLTGTELSAMFSQTKSAVSSWEKRGRQPSQEILIQLAVYFNVSLDYLLGLSDDRTPISAGTKSFAEKLVKQLVDDDMIKDATEIDDNIISLIISALKIDIANKKKGAK